MEPIERINLSEIIINLHIKIDDCLDEDVYSEVSSEMWRDEWAVVLGILVDTLQFQ